jgi:hypothetical protein
MKPIQIELPKRNVFLEFFFPYIRRMREEIERDRQTNLRKMGGTMTVEIAEKYADRRPSYLGYDLYSWDGGKIWYACRQEETGLVVLGRVEEVYPGLKEKLEIFDKLIENIKLNSI